MLLGGFGLPCKCSLGAPSGSISLQQSCDHAIEHQIVVVAAVGNTGPNDNTIGFPAQYASVIAVGATDSTNMIATFSSRGSQLSVVAPGVNILSTFKGNAYATGSGTSMACPHVTGTVALMLAKDPNSAATVKATLKSTANDLGSIGFDTTYGYGIINAAKACGIAG